MGQVGGGSRKILVATVGSLVEVLVQFSGAAGSVSAASATTQDLLLTSVELGSFNATAVNSYTFSWLVAGNVVATRHVRIVGNSLNGTYAMTGGLESSMTVPMLVPAGSALSVAYAGSSSATADLYFKFVPVANLKLGEFS